MLAALLPYTVRWLTLSSTAYLLPLHITLAGSAAAIFLGTWLFRSITTYPGAEASSYILPVFSVAYGVLAMAFIVARLDYNIPLLVAGYFISLAWFFWLVAILRGRQALRIGVVAMVDGQQLPSVRGIHWIAIATPACGFDGLDAVTTDLRQDLPDEWDRKLTDLALAGVPVYHFKHLAESLTGRVELEHLSENSFGSLSPVSAYMSIKHAADWVAALVCGILFLPALLIIAVAIKFSSPGPVLFRQTRVGYRGQRFTVFKFRTMRITPPGEADGRTLAMTQTDDQRIYPLGRFLRTSRLDELPQIINVLRGEMSWIGPRPEAEVLSEWYEREIPFYRYRHIVRPGIAGWAQVCQGHVVEVEDVRSKLHYDFYYIKNYSLWLDLLIAMKTVRIMVTGHGSK
ncbi:sugar transferase [Sphingomonas changnyeongensis]|uniref:sugar transferase n=1 Tax=Sphingomonas changnyeongensis TaxID=2698679 RepID=UPI001E5F016C|nr:sugar transferase [Sphingomonas changnyeongensis]